MPGGHCPPFSLRGAGQPNDLRLGAIGWQSSWSAAGTSTRSVSLILTLPDARRISQTPSQTLFPDVIAHKGTPPSSGCLLPNNLGSRQGSNEERREDGDN